MKNFTKYTDSAIVLRFHRLKATPARILTLEFFKKSDEPISAHKIAGMNVAHIASIYRALETFEKEGLIRKVWFEIKDGNDRRNKEIFYELK